MESFDVIVIGQGYAGLTAAKLAVQRGLRTANFESECMGGLILNINELDPAPAGAEPCGAELASNLAMSNVDSGVVSVSDKVTVVESLDDGTWLVKAESDDYLARHVVVASGARLRKLGVAGEEQYFGRGVSECADCDGPLFDGKEAVVVGGGDSAFQEALKLAEFASKVTVVMRAAAPRARLDLVGRAAANPKLVQLANTQVLAVLGDGNAGVTGVRVQTAGASEVTLACAGVFVFIGLQPTTGFLPEGLRKDAGGALITSEQCATELPGLWAIGAVRSGYSGMLVDAAAEAGRVVQALS